MKQKNVGAKSKRLLTYAGTLSVIALLGIILCKGIYTVIQNTFYELGIAHEVDMLAIMKSVGSEMVDAKLWEVKSKAEHKAEIYAEKLSAGTQQEIEKLLAEIERETYRLGYCYYSEEGMVYGSPAMQNDYVNNLDLGRVKQNGETMVYDPDFDENGNYVMAVAAPVQQNGKNAGVFVELLDGFCISKWIGPMSLSLEGVGIYNNLGTCYIINNKGRDIAVSQEENYEWIKTRYSAWELAESVGDEVSKSVSALERNAIQGENGTGSYLWEGQTSHLAYGPLKEADWAIVVGVYGQEFERYTNEALRQSGKVWIALLLIFTLFLGNIIVLVLASLARQRRYNLLLLEQKEEIQKQALSIAASEERFRLAMEQTGNIIIEYQINSGDLISFYSGNRVEHGNVEDALVKKKLLDGVEMDEQSFRNFKEAFKEIRQDMSGKECMLSAADGEKWYHMSVSIVPNVNGVPMRAIGIVKDATSEHQVKQDLLTGLFNKVAATQIAREAVEQNEPNNKGAFCMLDVDRFKTVNDTYGHQVGDALIVKIANILRQVFPETYKIGRFGGDEFCVLCPEKADPDLMRERLEQLCEQIREITVSECSGCVSECQENKKLGISCSCGVAFYTGRADFEEVYRMADEALYEIKTNGKNGYRFL